MYTNDSAGHIGFKSFTVSKQLTQEREFGILEFLTSPAGIITMSIFVGGAIGLIVVIKKKKDFHESTDKEIMRIEKIIQGEVKRQDEKKTIRK